jgi:hypothetical protein
MECGRYGTLAKTIPTERATVMAAIMNVLRFGNLLGMALPQLSGRFLGLGV